MSWINAAILWSLPLGLIPIIIYYLMRFRTQKVPWGATYVLELALKRLKHRLRLDQILLLALRTLACLALVIAFARPTWGPGDGRITASGVHHVVILDGSLSMLARSGAQNRWDRARQMLKQLTATWGRGEVWSLYFMDEQPRWLVDGQTIDTPQKTAELIDSLRPGQGTASLAQALEQVERKFPGGGYDLFILADDQAGTWAQADQAKPLAAQTRACWVNFPADSYQNSTITALKPATERLLAQHPSSVYVSLRHYGSEPAVDVPVLLNIDGRFLSQQPVTLQPGLETVVRFDFNLHEPGSHELTARLRDDALSADNAMSAGVQVDRQLSMLVLRDPAKTDKFDSAWRAFTALSKMQDASPEFIQMGPLMLALHEGELDAAKLAGVDVVWVDGGTALTAKTVGLLKSFVNRGGGLILAADDAVDAVLWNRLFNEAGLLPARLGPLRSERYGGPRFATLARSDFGDQVMRVFEGEEGGDLRDVRFYNWFELILPTVSDPTLDKRTVLAVFEDRKPYVVRQRDPLGCVLLLASDLSGRGNTMIVREVFLPMLFRLVNEASAGGNFPRNLAPGQPIRLALKPNDPVQAATFQLQGEAPVPLPPQRKGERTILELPEGSRRDGLASILTVGPAGHERTWFGIQGPRLDSDLTPLSSEQQKALADHLGLFLAQDWPQLQQWLLSDQRGREWHLWVILALLLILLAEMLVQRRFVYVRK